MPAFAGMTNENGRKESSARRAGGALAAAQERADDEVDVAVDLLRRRHARGVEQHAVVMVAAQRVDEEMRELLRIVRLQLPARAGGAEEFGDARRDGLRARAIEDVAHMRAA